MREQEEGGSTPLTLQVGLEGTTIVVLFNKKVTQLDLTPEQATVLANHLMAAAKVSASMLTRGIQLKGTIQ